MLNRIEAKKNTQKKRKRLFCIIIFFICISCHAIPILTRSLPVWPKHSTIVVASHSSYLFLGRLIIILLLLWLLLLYLIIIIYEPKKIRFTFTQKKRVWWLICWCNVWQISFWSPIGNFRFLFCQEFSKILMMYEWNFN